MIIHAYETRVPVTIGVGQKARGISTVGAWGAIGGRLAKSALIVFRVRCPAVAVVFHILSRYLEWARADWKSTCFCISCSAGSFRSALGSAVIKGHIDKTERFGGDENLV